MRLVDLYFSFLHSSVNLAGLVVVATSWLRSERIAIQEKGSGFRINKEGGPRVDHVWLSPSPPDSYDRF